MASTLSWQGRCGGNPINVADTMAAWGVSASYDPADSDTALYAAIIKQSNPDAGSAYYAHATATPQGLQGSTPSTADTGAGWEIFTEMCLRSRSIFWAEKKIGDCSSGQPAYNGTGVGADIGIAYSFGVEGANIGASLAGTTIAALSSVASNLIPIVGSLLAPIISAFQQHAKNVALEQETLCQLTAAATQAIQQIYAGVESGQVTPSQAYAAMQQLYAGFKAAGAGVTKQFCDGGCGLNATMLAHVNFAAIAFGLAPAPAGTRVSLVTASAAQSGISALDSFFGLGTPSAPASGAPSALSFPAWAWVAVAVLLVFILMGGGK